MADDYTPPRQMSLIPYSDAHEVVLRRGNAVVVYDAQSRQLSVRDASEHALDLGKCPHCHRPYRDDVPSDSSNHGQHFGSSERAFMDPDYFAMLAASQHPTPNASGTTTPNRRLYQPALRSGRSRDVSGSSGPPAGSGFLGGTAATSSGERIASSAISDGFFKTNLAEKAILGRGGSGVVLLVEHLMAGVSLGYFACKRIPVGDDHSWLEKLLVEVKLLKKIPHPNLVAYHWVWLEHHQPNRFGPSIPCLWILQEYCNGGDLHNFVLGPKEEPATKEKMKERMRRKSRGDAEPPTGLRSSSKLTFEQIASFFKDITTGLHHLHSEGYIHRDLKPSNCLLQCDQSGKVVKVLISDFGEAQAADAKRGSTGATGTISYCAPEVLRKDTPDGTYGDFTPASDIFSLGMIVHFMVFGGLPYSNVDEINEENEDLDVLRAEIERWAGFDDGTRTRTDLPKELYKFLKRLLSVDPNERPNTEEILNSIKGGAPLGEVYQTSEDSSHRILPMDVPVHRPSPPGRRQSAYVSRQGLPSLGQESAGNEKRSRSPAKQRLGTRSQENSRPTSPLDSSVVLRPRKIELPNISDTTQPQQSPRLMLPAPPQRPIVERSIRFLEHPTTIVSIRALLFAMKVVSLFLPCSPYAARVWLLYPLLGFAALDTGILRFEMRRSLLFSGVHFTAIVVAYQHACLCERPVIVWEDL